MRTDQNHPVFLFAIFISAVTMLAGGVPSLQADEHSSDLFLQSLPENTVLYINVQNIQKHMEAYENQVMQQMSDQQKNTYKNRKQELLNEFSSRVNEEMGIDPINLLSHITRVRMAVVSSELNMDANPGSENPLQDASFLLSAEVDRADVVSQMLTGEVAERLSQEKSVNDYTIYRINMPEEAKEAPASYFLHRNKELYVTENLDRLTAIAEGPDSEGFPDASLAESQSFQESVPAESSSSDVVDAYMNISSFWDQLEGSLEKQQKMIYGQAAKLLGFEEMQRITMGMDRGDDMVSYELAVHMSGNDFPLYDLLIQADPGTLDLLNTIPSDAMTGSASRFPDYADRLSDIKKKVVEGMTMFGQKKKKARQQWDMGMMMAKKQLGVGVKKLLRQLGTQMAYYVRAPESSEEVSNPQMYNVKNGVLRVSLDDGEQFTNLFEETIRSSTGYKQLKQMESTTTYNGVKLYTYQAQEGIKPAMFVQDDQLVLAGSAADAKAALDRGDSKSSSIAGASWFQSLRSELPESLTHLQFVEVKKYQQYAKSMQEQAMKQTDLWSELPFNQDLLMDMSGTLDSETGVLFGYTTEADRVLLDGTGQFNFSGMNPDTLNEMLKSMTDELKKEQETSGQGKNSKQK